MTDAEKELQQKLQRLCQSVIDAKDHNSLMVAIRELNDYLDIINSRELPDADT